MGEVQWIKLYLDIFDTNQKIKKIRRLPAGSDIVLIWIMLLVKAGRCNAGGHIFITENIPFTVEDLADEFKFEVGTIKLAMNAFVDLDMIVIDEEGFIFITGWEEYQSIDKLAEIREQTRKRVAKCREKKLLAQCNVTSNATVTQCNGIEEEKEEDEEKEKEFHSFVHSAREENIYIEKKVQQEGFEGEDAEVYREELRERLRRNYMGGELGQGVVFISDEQFDDLCGQLSLGEIEKYFGIIVGCERKGKRYKKKTHYQAILDMARKDRKIE